MPWRARCLHCAPDRRPASRHGYPRSGAQAARVHPAPATYHTRGYTERPITPNMMSRDIRVAYL